MSPSGEFSLFGRDDLADSAALHHLADVDRLGVGRRIAHAPAHVWVEREPFGPQQHLARPRLRHRKFLQPEIGRLRLADRAGGKHDAAGGVGHGELRQNERSGVAPGGNTRQTAQWVRFAGRMLKLDGLQRRRREPEPGT